MTAPARALIGRAQRYAQGTTVVERRRAATVTTEISIADFLALEAHAVRLKLSKAALVRQIIRHYLDAVEVP